MPKLLITSGENKGQVLILEDQDVSIGHDPANTLYLSDRRVSRKHAIIRRIGEEYQIEDLDSVNGTFINNALIYKSVLHYGDEIKLGATSIRFLSKSASEKIDEESSVIQVMIVQDDKVPDGLTMTAGVVSDKVQFLEDELKADGDIVKKAYEKLMLLYRVSHELGRVIDLQQLFDKILELVLDVIKADRGVIVLADEETNNYVVKSSKRKQGSLDEQQFVVSQTIIKHVMETSESILTSDAKEDERFKNAQSIVSEDIRSIMCVPIKSKDKVLGIMQIDSIGKIVSFAREDLQLLTAISEQAAVAIENALLFDDLKRKNKEIQMKQGQLIEAEKLSAIGRLAGGVAHEINNPLTSILGYSDLVAEQYEKGEFDDKRIEDGKKYMGIVESEVHRCIQIAQSLLQFSRKQKEEMVETDINKVIKLTLDVARFHIKGARIKIETDLDDSLPKVNANANQLQQVFLNFIINARDAMENDGLLKISSSKSCDGWAEVRFEDDGCGIPLDKIEEIFKPLYTSKEEGKGTGLGLSISQDIVEKHMGKIDVESEVGKGTTFVIKLPIES